MKETIKQIKELAIATDNSFLLLRIKQLETEIEIAIIDAEIKVYNHILKK